MNNRIEAWLRLRDSKRFKADAKEAGAAIRAVGRDGQTMGNQVETAGKKTDKASKATERLQKRSLVGSHAVKTLAGAVGIAGVAFGGYEAIHSSVETTEELGMATLRLNRNFGMSVKTAGDWAAMARARNIDLRQLQMGFTVLSRNVVGVEGGNKKAAASFKLLGISAKDVKAAHGDVNKVIGLVAEGLRKTPGNANRAAAAQALLGRGAQALIPLLGKGSAGLAKQREEVRKYGAVLGVHSVKELRKFIKAEHENKYAMMGLQVQLGQVFIPLLTKGMTAVNKFVLQFRRGTGAGGDLKDVLNKVGKVISTVTGYLGEHHTVLKVLIAAFIAWNAAMLLNNLALKAYSLATTVMAVGSKAAAAAQWLWNAALTANPIGVVVMAVVALGAALVLAYRKVGWFHRAVDAVWAFLRNNWKNIVTVLAGPMGIAVRLVISHWGQLKGAARSVTRWVINAFHNFIGFFRKLPGRISSAASGMFNGVKSAFRSAVNWIIGKWNNLSFSIGGTDLGPFGHLPKVTLNTPDLPLLAAGGSVYRGGAAIVGERGPELATFPAGASVHPLRLSGVRPARGTGSSLASMSSVALAGGGGQRTIVVPVHLNGREIARAVARDAADEQARR